MTEIADVFAALNRARVKYLLIGGYASVVHGVPRTTLDIDIALDPDRRNVERTLRAETDHVEDVLAQGGVSATNDRSVDLLTSLPVATFAALWSRRAEVVVQGVRIRVVSRADQVRLLQAAGRPGDLQDAESLEEQEG